LKAKTSTIQKVRVLGGAAVHRRAANAGDMHSGQVFSLRQQTFAQAVLPSPA
jgi:hypothetical protein